MSLTVLAMITHTVLQYDTSPPGVIGVGEKATGADETTSNKNSTSSLRDLFIVFVFGPIRKMEMTWVSMHVFLLYISNVLNPIYFSIVLTTLNNVINSNSHVWLIIRTTYDQPNLDIIWLITYGQPYMSHHIWTIIYDSPHTVVIYDSSHTVDHIWLTTYGQPYMAHHIWSTIYDQPHMINHIWCIFNDCILSYMDNHIWIPIYG